MTKEENLNIFLTLKNPVMIKQFKVNNKTTTDPKEILIEQRNDKLTCTHRICLTLIQKVLT